MKASELCPAVKKQVVFALASIGVVPDVPGCYALTAFSGEIVYIGQSRNLNRRFAEHCEDPDKRTMTPFGVVQFMYFRLCDVSDLDHLEARWTNQFAMRSGGALPYLGRVNPPSA